MPNYLQRIVTSAARTTSAAKPGAFSRALMPPMIAHAYTPIGESGLQTAEERFDPMMPVRDEHESAAIKDEIVSPATASHEESQQTVLGADRGSTALPNAPIAWPTAFAPAPGVRVQAPKGLRNIQPGNVRKQEIIRTIDETVRHVSPKPNETKAESQGSLESPTTVSAPPGETPQIQHQDSVQPLEKPITASPRPVTAKTEAPIVHITAERTVVQQEAKSVMPGDVSDQVSPAIKMSESKAKPLGKDEGSPQSLLTPRRVAEKQITEVRPLEPQVTTSRQIMPPTISNTTDKRRRSQISIGRIDVQVNSQPAPQPPSPPTKLPISSNFLDARYLSRFFLRP